MHQPTMRKVNSFLLWIVTLIASVQAVSEIVQLSLANLVTIESLNDISVNWDTGGAAIYEEGRIILTPKPQVVAVSDDGFEYGSLWTTKSPESLDSFTTELTIRSLGAVGYTDAGISLFIIDANSDVKADLNFGGPAIFKGLQVLLNHDRTLGPVIRIYLNDGSKKLDVNSDFIGAYKNEYQGASVPLTIKVSYADKFLKITSDNKLLFETDKVNLSPLLSNPIKLGVTAQSKKQFDLNENFEVLRLMTYDAVTNEMKEKNDETLFAKHDQLLAQQKPLANNFREQEARLIAQLQNRNKAISDVGTDTTSLDKELSMMKESMALLLKEVKTADQTAVRQQLFTLDKSIDRLVTNYGQLQSQYNELSGKIDELTVIFKKQFNLLDNYDSSLRAFDKVLQTQLESADKLDTKISSLFTQYSNNVRQQKEPVHDDIFAHIKSLLYMILFPVVALLILVVLWVHRLRNDIKHAKVL